jgi:tRNA nucleotidyltransferase/poly(A) polymerase
MFEFAEIGGAVRDKFLGVESKDVDFVAIPSDDLRTLSLEEVFSLLENELKQQRFEIFLVTPEFVTIRAKVPDNHSLRSRTSVADFVLARKDGPSSDGRRPDFVLPGSLQDDLERRDFTVNAIAILKGEIIDPFGGIVDIENRVLKFVGDPNKRIAEDGLRVLRFFRFIITKGFTPEENSWNACMSLESAKMVQKTKIERIKDEFDKMFIHDTVAAMKLISSFPEHLIEVIFRDNLRLISTLKKNPK